MKTPAITIVMPSYNGVGRGLKEAIASVLDQPFQDWELIISDNASTDDVSRPYLQSLNDPRIRVFYQEKNLGIYGNLNFIFKQVRTELSLILCDDDYLLPDGLNTVLHSWQTLPAEIGLIAFNRKDQQENTTCPTRRLAYQVVPDLVPTEKADLFHFIFWNLTGNLSNVSVRTALIGEVGWFRPEMTYCGDVDLWSRLARKQPLYLSKESVSFIRTHENQTQRVLSRFGEPVRQQGEILDDLISRLKTRYPELLLRLYAHMTMDMNQWNVAGAALIRRRQGQYLQTLLKYPARYNFPLLVRLLIVLLTLRGKFAYPKVSLARRFLAEVTPVHGLVQTQDPAG